MNRLFWILFSILSIFLFAYFIVEPKIQYGGDIIEYFGNTESIINHQSVDLTQTDKDNLIERLGAGYFDNPEYYIEGLNGKRYSVHFPFYSILNIPSRLFLRAIGNDEYKAFRITNLVILTIVSIYILSKYLDSVLKKSAFVVIAYLSPIIWHLVWPGPEVLNFALTLLVLFLFFNGNQKEKIWAIILSAIASYQSQPLIFVPLGFLFLYFYEKYKYGQESLKLSIRKDIVLTLFLLVIIFLPNIYYYYIFGVLSSWFKLTDVGFENSSTKKLFELFFDLNIGIFFFAPIIFIEGIYPFFKSVKREISGKVLLLAISLVTAFYLINTNWNNGTAGYGPTRYALHFLPFLIYYYLTNVKKNLQYTISLTLVIITQLFILSFNGFLMPDFENTLRLTPYAKYVLNTIPAIYNPTPEIFVERTTEKEGGYWDSTVYYYQDKCKKAYVLTTDIQRVIDSCGEIPSKYDKKLENKYLRIANYPRTVITTEATFYPADGACSWESLEDKENPYVCMRTIEDVVKYTKISDEGRFEKLEDQEGVWHLFWGRPAKVIVPPGYIIHHYSFEGTYVNF